jgi:hypothetical protein
MTETRADNPGNSESEAEPPRSPSRVPLVLENRAPRWMAPAALLVAVIAVGLAVWALMDKPTEAAAGVQQTGDPKTNVCSAFDTVTKAVQLQTHTDLGPDPIAVEAVAGNARVALLGGGQYLLSRLEAGTPQELADAVRLFATNLQDIGANALAGIPNTDPVQAGRLRDGQADGIKVARLCA